MAPTSVSPYATGAAAETLLEPLSFYGGATQASLRRTEELVVEEQKARIRRALTVARQHGPSKDEETGAWKLRNPTALEQQSMQKAVQKLRGTRTQKQVVLGKEYKGPGFLPSPSQVVFKDFEVGREEERTFTLTNVSWTFSTFKVLDFDLDISDFFEVFYSRPGQMSAGTSCELTVRFTPKVNKDIHSAIRFLGKTGSFDVPLIATTKKVVVTVSPAAVPGAGRVVDFGPVVLAETAQRQVVVSNAGALPTRFDVLGDVLKHPEFSVDPPRCEDVYLGPHSSYTITLTYSPKELGEATAPLLLHFSTPETEDAVVTIRAHSTEVPVYVREDCETIDLRCCFTDTLYRVELALCNRGKTSIKVTPTVPQFLKPFLEYVPKFAFIQPGSSLAYQVKFRPSRSIFKHLDESGQLDTSILVGVLGQALPVRYRLRARLTKAELVFSESSLVMPVCALGQGVSRELAVTNTSLLPLEVGFVDLPKEVSVTPNKGFACLQPGKEKTFIVSCVPSVVGGFEKRLVMRTERNGEYTIAISTQCIRPPFLLSDAVVRLPATAEGDRSEHSFLLTNPTSSRQRYAISPQGSFLSASPASGTLPPGGSAVILLSFAPDMVFFKEGASVPEGWCRLEEGGETTSWHRTSTVYFSTEPPQVCMEVVQCVVPPLAVVDQPKLAFGSVPACDATVQYFSVRSLSLHSLVLRPSLLDPFGPFQLVRPPMHPIPPGGSVELALRFCPSAAAAYDEPLTISCEEVRPDGRISTLRLRLRGTGLSPEISVDDTEVAFDPTVPWEEKRREVALKSSCGFDVPFSFSLPEGRCRRVNASGSHPFAVFPQSGVVPAGGTATVTFCFLPDEAYPGHEAEAECCYGGHHQSICFVLKGDAWPSSFFVRCPEGLPLSGRLGVSPSGELRANPDQDPAGVVEKWRRVQLLFTPDVSRDRVVLRDAVHSFHLGCVRTADPKSSAPGEATVDPKQLAEAEGLGFKLTGLGQGGRVAVAPGQPETRVDIVFSPKDASGKLAAHLYDLLPVPGVSLELETVLDFSLKGGSPPVTEGSCFSLLLKGSIKVPA